MALLFVAVLTDKLDLGILVAQEGAELHEVKVVWNEYYCVTLAVDIDAVPKFLREEVEPSGVAVLVGTDVGQPPESYLDVLLLADFLGSVGVHCWDAHRAKRVARAVLAKDEF